MIKGAFVGKVYAIRQTGEFFPVLVWDSERYEWHMWYCSLAPKDDGVHRVLASAVGPSAPFCKRCRLK